MFYIKPQLFHIDLFASVGCILFVFYIKPQPHKGRAIARPRCILFVFYIKPQLPHPRASILPCCILFVFYIKPQPYTSPTSSLSVVSYSCSTSNHNTRPERPKHNLLYLIRVLHQTTTTRTDTGLWAGCILFVFYIKPQPNSSHLSNSCVVSYSCSTSNHNRSALQHLRPFVVSYSCSTSNHNRAKMIQKMHSVVSYSCSTSNHN